MDERLISQLPLCVQETELLAKEIEQGKWGEDGTAFLSTKALSEKRGISVVTAHRVLSGLCEKGVLLLKGKRYFLQYGEKIKKKQHSERIIGLHVNNINNEYFSRIARAAGNNAFQKDYRLLIAESNYEHERERDILEMFQKCGVKGVLSCPGIHSCTGELYENYPLPYTFLGRTPKHFKGQSVQTNAFPIALRIAEHFIDEDYREFAYAGLDEFNIEEDLRLFGYKSYLKSEGFSLPKRNILTLGVQDSEEKSKHIRTFLQNCSKPIAVFCYHDLIAIDFFKACYEIGLSVPEDVGLAGFDNLFASACIVPALTTVDYRLEKLVEIAFSRLLDQIEHQKKDKINYFIEPKLIIRGSTMRGQ